MFFNIAPYLVFIVAYDGRVLSANYDIFRLAMAKWLLSFASNGGMAEEAIIKIVVY
jgi:hypothetical protein